jgi:hypothetical protein
MTAPMHLARATQRVKPAKVVKAATDYPPGYFLSPVLAWWPGWRSSIEVTSNGRLAAAQLADAWSRAQTGTGWGSGTVLMPNTPKNDAPGWMR